jgi:hypothetical protein
VLKGHPNKVLERFEVFFEGKIHQKSCQNPC